MRRKMCCNPVGCWAKKKSRIVSRWRKPRWEKAASYCLAFVLNIAAKPGALYLSSGMRLIHPGDDNFRVMKFISLSICFLFTFSSIGFSQTKATSDPLKAYTKCKVPDDLEIKEVSRYQKSADKFRKVKTANG